MGPNGRQNREAMVRRFFLRATTLAVERKVLNKVHLGDERAPEGDTTTFSSPSDALRGR